MENLNQKLPCIQAIVAELNAEFGDDFFTISPKWANDRDAIGLMHDGMTVHITAVEGGENFLLVISTPLENNPPLLNSELDSEEAVVEEVLDFFS